MYRAVALDGQAAGGRVRHVMRHESHLVRIQPGQRRGVDDRGAALVPLPAHRHRSVHLQHRLHPLDVERLRHRHYTREVGDDMPDVRDWAMPSR